MQHEWIERYIYAVVRTLPAKMRQDVEKELRSLIFDMLEERCGLIPPTEHDVLVVLTELGKPAELAAKYKPEQTSYLIGPNYYRPYKFLLGLVCGAVSLGMTIALLILALTDGQPWYVFFANWFSELLISLLCAFGGLTLAFAILERKKVKIDFGGQEIEHLPPVPKKKERIPRTEPMVGIVFCIVFAVLFLAVPQVIGVIWEGTEWIAVFNVEKIQSSWFIIVLFAGIGIVRESAKLYEGRYTRRLRAVSLVCNVCSAALACWFLMGSSILNPAFVEKMQTLFTGQEAFLSTIFGQFNYAFLAVMLFALCLDSAVTTYRAFKYDQK